MRRIYLAGLAILLVAAAVPFIVTLRGEPGSVAAKIVDASDAEIRSQAASGDTFRRRVAVVESIRRGLPISADVLREMLLGTPGDESLLLPEHVSVDGNLSGSDGKRSMEHALRVMRARTLETALAGYLHQARSFGMHPDPQSIEPLIDHTSVEVRKYVIRVLAAIPGYNPTEAVRASIAEDTADVRRTAALVGLR